MPNITLSNIQKNYGGGSPNAVENLNLEIGDGEFMCLLGPSGCGKTTTLRMISGLEHPTGGKITIGNRVVDSVTDGVFVPPEKRELGLVFQSYALWPHLTIENNVDFGLRLRKIPRAERESRTTEVMEKMGIAKYRKRYPSELSGGQQQRVALARMLAVNPGVLLLDEPLSNLDARLRLEMRAELKRIHEEFNTTIVFVTHDQWEAMTLATKIGVMSDGELQQLGTPDEIYGAPANRFVAEFVGSPPINIIQLADDETGGLSLWAMQFLSHRYAKIESLGSLGIRPETVHVAVHEIDVPDAAFKARSRVTGVLPTGGSWIIELEVAERKIFSVTSELPSVKAGEEVYFWVRPEDLHLFDVDGNRAPQAELVLSEVGLVK
ncbi:ABC transporter ATP-binding protein [Paramicrobacterium chengjingii]|uniref:ABC transporter ATP-binding protein n=1 Tax=Paramicrobacterium chengjingii TaxID=2769067 RepID=A0ABX6YIA4_9MICO|nr:ABC transporter ATP-binding protein [Microbacterium chengjingii]QPZ38502.1 ABC transporter ATP-binding protein [Microbacterium chengjingii]